MNTVQRSVKITSFSSRLMPGKRILALKVTLENLTDKMLECWLRFEILGQGGFLIANIWFSPGNIASEKSRQTRIRLRPSATVEFLGNLRLPISIRAPSEITNIRPYLRSRPED